MRRVLFVDDATEVLQHLRRTLAPMESEWEMQFFASARQALAAIREKPCDVVVSDMTMPEMDGAALLGEVRKVCPQTIRIVLSGDQSPYNHVRSAAVAHRFLRKPFDGATLKSTIERAEALRVLLDQPSLRQLVGEIKTLPSLPSIYQELMREMQSPQASLKKVARIVAKDLGMVTKILQLVNSAFFGLRTRVADPEQAVALLGVDAIKSLVLSAQVFAQFDRTTVPSFSLDELWRHAMLAGTCSRHIAKEEGVIQPVMDEAFTAALLHDVGLLLLAANRPEDYARVLDRIRATGVADWQAEREVFGADHAQVGAYLLGLWGLGDGIVEAVAFHHQPAEYAASGFCAVTAVHVGNALAETQAHWGSGTVEIFGLDEAYVEREHLSSRLTRWRELCAAA
ncbi:MAG: Response regulator [Nitrospira sp.]|jgi:HD-like signal output (HDOD) protein/ActR/RegA family two-component response regulator|nr:MAG: Response regulator [Nitrospira sp.]